MAQWRKVIVSGSNSELNHITSSGDLFLSTDGAQMKFGADREVTLTHVHNDGLLLSDASGIGTTKLSFGDTTTFLQQSSDGVLGIDSDNTIEMSASAVSMSHDVYVGGDIFAVGEITFQGSSGGDIRLGDNVNDNLVVGADVSSSLIPNNNDSFNLGSTTQRWNDLFLSGSLSASGGHHDLDSDSTITLDSAAGTSIDAGAASNFSTTAGDLTLEAGAANAKVVIKGDHTGGTAVHIDANENAASVVDIDAGILDIDAGGSIDMDSAGAIAIGTVNTTGITIGHGSTITTTINGNLDVNGTLTTIDTENLQIKDAFIHVASGSNSATNAGIVANTTADGSGSAFYYDGNRNRWAATGPDETAHNATGDIAPRQFVMTVSQSAMIPNGNPNDFGNNPASYRGAVYIQTADDPSNSNNVDGDIWIFS